MTRDFDYDDDCNDRLRYQYRNIIVHKQFEEKFQTQTIESFSLLFLGQRVIFFFLLFFGNIRFRVFFCHSILIHSDAGFFFARDHTSL